MVGYIKMSLLLFINKTDQASFIIPSSASQYNGIHRHNLYYDHSARRDYPVVERWRASVIVAAILLALSPIPIIPLVPQLLIHLLLIVIAAVVVLILTLLVTMSAVRIVLVTVAVIVVVLLKLPLPLKLLSPLPLSIPSISLCLLLRPPSLYPPLAVHPAVVILDLVTQAPSILITLPVVSLILLLLINESGNGTRSTSDAWYRCVVSHSRYRGRRTEHPIVDVVWNRSKSKLIIFCTASLKLD